MAKQLYDYWFVQFDFPNEEGKPYKSSGGKMVWNDKLKREIPEGWDVDALNTWLEIKSGFPFKSETYQTSGRYKVITIKNVQDGELVTSGCDFVDEIPSRAKEYIALKIGDRLISLTGNCGRLCIVCEENLLLNQRVGLLSCNSLYLEYLYNLLNSQLMRMVVDNLANGAAQANLSPVELCKTICAMPQEDTLLEYNRKANVFRLAMVQNNQEIATLTKQRDELLPLLMNGQVSVNYHLANKNNVVNTLFRAKLLTLYKIGLNMSENIKLWDIIDSFVSGDWGNEEESPEAPCCVSCIRGADIVPICNSDFDNIPIRYISNRSFTTHCLQEGDIIVEKSGGSPTQSTGRVVYISKELLAAKHDIVCSNFCVAFRVKPEWNSLYIYYYLRNVYNAGVFFNFEGKTSGIKNLDIETAFKAIPIKTIAMETQISIATAISCLDKKIALNRAINDNLEAMAKQLYDYWFVQFDFPNEEGKPYKSSGGKMVWSDELQMNIPHNWVICRLNDYIDKNNTGDWGNDTPSNNSIEVGCIRGADILKLNNLPRRYIKKNNIAKLLSDWDMVIEVSGGSPTQATGRCALITPGTIKRNGGKITCSNFCHAFSFKSYKYSAFFFFAWKMFYVNDIMFNYEGKTSGIKNFMTETFLANKWVMPKQELVDRFFERIRSIYSQIDANIAENNHLTKQRDELLPLLMNGQVSVNYHLSHD